MRRGWTGSRIAAQIGLHPSVVSRTLRGESKAAATQLLIANFAGLSPRELFGAHCNPTIITQPTPGRRPRRRDHAA